MLPPLYSGGRRPSLLLPLILPGQKAAAGGAPWVGASTATIPQCHIQGDPYCCVCGTPSDVRVCAGPQCRRAQQVPQPCCLLSATQPCVGPAAPAGALQPGVVLSVPCEGLRPYGQAQPNSPILCSPPLNASTYSSPHPF